MPKKPCMPFWPRPNSTKNDGPKIVLALVAGFIGGLAKSLGLWGSGVRGISSALGLKMTPALSLPCLAPRLVQGTLWGLAFGPPFWKFSSYKKGMVIAMAQTMVMLVIIFPKWVLAIMEPSSGPPPHSLSSSSPLAGQYQPPLFLKITQ